MKHGLVALMAVTVALSGIAYADLAADAALEMALLLQFTDELGLGDYEMMDVLAGYRQYRSTMDGYMKQREEKQAALKKALAQNDSGPSVSTLTQDIMGLDMNILRLKQSAVNEASAVMDAKAVAKLYMMVSNMDQVKKGFMAKLAGKHEVPARAQGKAPAGKMKAKNEGAAPAAAPVEKPEESILSQAKVFLNKLAAKELDAAMAAVSEKFEHYEYGSKAELRSFLDEAVQAGYVDDLKIITDDTEVKIEGDKAVIYPVDVEGLFGSFTLELTCQKEGDSWMVSTLDIFGI
ncbi:MAG TPA: hypothetical protein PLC40_05415 [Candidatus Hydrogenedentes bacterium]|nr:hypothetical protein [Candidatus Hydrogenedentota bacterium]